MRNESRRSGFTKIEMLVVLLINAGLVLLLLPAVQNQHAADGPLGEMIPVTTPKEENRIKHPSGFSIIAPPNWVQKYPGPDFVLFRLAPRQHGARRILSALTISREGPLDPSRVPKGFKKVSFQGYRAFERLVVTREYLFDDPPISEYDLLIDRDSQGWHVNFTASTSMAELPPIMREYFDTIRFPPPSKEAVE